MRNITERRERERRYNAIFNQTYQFTGLLEPDGTVLEANKTALEFVDAVRDDVVGKSLWETDWWPKDDGSQQRLREAIDRAASGEFVRYEVEVEGTEETAIMDFSIRPITDEQGNVTMLIPEGRDITERKEREQEVEALKERYQTLLDAAPDPVFVADGETGELIEANQAAETLLGLPSDEIIGMHQSELHPSEEAEQYRKLFEEHVRSEGTRRRLPDGSPISVVTADGERVPVEISVDTVHLPDGPVTYGIFRDISARVEREEELREKARQLEAIVENSSEAIYIKDTEGYYQFINEFGAEVLGHTPEEVLGKHDEDLFDAESAAEIRAIDEQIVETGTGVSEEAVRFIDGEEHVFLDDKYPYRDQDGEIIGIMGISRDITDRKQKFGLV
jgi:PAS domain S-box-containing protein